MAHIIQCTGLSWDTVLEEFDLPRVHVMNEYWQSHPPVHLMVAAYFGIKPKPKFDKKSLEEQDFGQLMSQARFEENPDWIPKASA